MQLYHVGQCVRVAQARPLAISGSFKVVRVMPPEGRKQQYRVKSDTEAFERIVDECRMEPSPL
jgi:hypothetical protein